MGTAFTLCTSTTKWVKCTIFTKFTEYVSTQIFCNTCPRNKLSTWCLTGYSWKKLFHLFLREREVLSHKSTLQLTLQCKTTFNSNPRPGLFKRWIMLSPWKITTEWIELSVLLTFIHWVAIYPVDNVIQPLNNWCHVCVICGQAEHKTSWNASGCCWL